MDKRRGAGRDGCDYLQSDGESRLSSRPAPFIALFQLQQQHQQSRADGTAAAWRPPIPPAARAL